MHRRPIIPIILFLGLIVAGTVYLRGQQQASADGPLTASGTVEAVQLTIAPELGGRVLEVLVGEGETVEAGQVLVRLDDSLLQAQLQQAEAALRVAEANYALVSAGNSAEHAIAAIARSNLELITTKQALQALSDNNALLAAQALQAVATAEKAVDDAGRRLDNLAAGSTQADIDAARATVVLAKDQLDKAQEDFDPWKNKPEDNVIRASFQAKLAAAQQAYDAAVRRLNNLLGTTNPLDLAQAEANLALAQARLTDAQNTSETLQAGPDPDDVALAQARVANAEAQLAAAQASSPTPEQVAVAQAQVDASRANQLSIQVQIQKMTLTAPSNGVVLSRLVEPGEIALPNAPLMTLARLDDLTITVFVPEDRYGQITLGDEVNVQVDSFPGEGFAATVVHIADRAEFTPRNVQTAEGRRTTVFAVKLSVSDTSGRLKPGMPADVVFENIR